MYKEADFPLDYRQAEVHQITTALYRLRSIAISGLAGMGKSNVVRFVVSHPQVRAHYLHERANDYAFVHLDCAGLARQDEAEILEEIVAQLCRQGLTAAPASLGNARRTLKEQILGLDPRLNLALFLDYFDRAAVELPPTFFDYLFHLRNSRPRANLCYVFASRRPIGPLHELQELLDDGCFVGPLSHRDALDSIRRDEARLGCVFDPVQREALIACTGGHPGLLKNASELLGSARGDARLPLGELAGQLLRSEKVRGLCEELWCDLTREEQNVLYALTQGLPLPPLVDRARLAYLKQSGLLRESGSALALFSPLFESFVRQRATVSGLVRITAVFPNQAQLQGPAGEQWVRLSPKLFALLRALTEAEGRALTTDQIIAQVYGEEAAGVSDAALAQLVKRLRGTLNPSARRLLDDPGYTCVETIRDVGYRLNG